MHCVPIHPSQVSALQVLAKRTYTAAFAHKNKPGVLYTYYKEAFTKRQLLRELHHPESHWYFAQSRSHLFGYLKFNEGSAQTEFQEPQGMEIERIYVDLPFLGKGIGAQLINFSIAKAISRKKTYIWLGVWEQNPQAIRFYKNQGFEITGTHDYDMVAEVQTDYIMRLDIS